MGQLRVLQRPGRQQLGRAGPTAAVAAALHALVEHWRVWWPRADLQRLAADVGDRLADAVAPWELDDVRPLGGGCVSLVCAATRAGRPVVVKVSPRGEADDEQLRSEGDVLALWRPTGAAVELLDRRDDGFTLLLERLQPGHSLDETGVPWEDKLAELGGLARRLHSAGAPPPSCVHIREFVGYWRRALAGRPDLLSELDELAEPADGDVACHFDLHPGNALRHGDRWKVIDPKGVRGDRHADVHALVCPQAPALADDRSAAAATARRWLAHYADAAGMDTSRARAWTRLRARAEAQAIDARAHPSQHDAAWALRLHRIADALG